MTQMEITKTGDDHYHVFADDDVTLIDEGVNGVQLMGMTCLTSKDILERLELEPIGHKITVTRE